MVFHLSLSDSKAPEVSRTLLNILVNLNKAVVWIVSTRPLTSKSSGLFTSLFVTVPSAPITIGINVTRMFPSSFSKKSRHLSLSLISSSFTLGSAGTAKSTIQQVFRKDSPEEFQIVHLPFILIVKFKVLAQFPVDHRPHPVMFSSKTFFALIYYIHLLYDWLFCFL